MRRRSEDNMNRSLFALVSLVVVSPALAADRTIQFAGMTWDVRHAAGGPGPNRFSDDARSVWVDDRGRLHLKIRRVGESWVCAEVSTQASLGYGEYRFQIATDVERYDPIVVAGLFTYLDDEREIDIEFSRWGDPKQAAAQYVVQPYAHPENIHRFELGLTGNDSTHLFHWKPGSVAFQSAQGHTEGVSPRRLVIQEWNCNSKDVPKAGSEKLHINLWLFKGQPPADGNEHELIVAAVRFKPAN